MLQPMPDEISEPFIFMFVTERDGAIITLHAVYSLKSVHFAHVYLTSKEPHMYFIDLVRAAYAIERILKGELNPNNQSVYEACMVAQKSNTVNHWRFGFRVTDQIGKKVFYARE